ncbi:MAG: 5'-methylthioadenosine/adenosylhomocysteine nucleosidase [Flavobacteriaceae bacterium]|nr:5'-methylthioadenosine/adenosylhomocysteine nucleosidase [Flavobacteriaceae bacterium]
MIAIISAMQEEIQALLNELKNTEVTKKGMRKYYAGTLFDKRVVLVFSRWGKIASAVTTTQLINDFTIDEIIFTGVAGAIKNDLNIGDIVIGRHLYQYDVDCSPIFKKFEIPILKKMFFGTSNSTKLMDSTNLFLESYSDFIPKDDATKFEIKTPKVIYGDIATGDQFISDDKKVKKINEQLPTVLCVEMEGAAVAQVCYEYSIPFSIIRIISDKANDNAIIDFPKFAKNVVSNYALGILKNYFA